MRNKSMDVMLAFGIIFVVLGHSYQPPLLYLPAYTFQVALFFFVSGYFFKSFPKINEKFAWIGKKIYSLLVPYFSYNIFYAILTFYLLSRGITLGVNFGEKFSFYDFFIIPFINGHQYYLYLPAWFVAQLFLVHFFAQFLVYRDRKFFLFISFVGALIISSIFVNEYSENQPLWFLILGKTSLALVFYLCGKILNTYELKIKKFLYSPEAFTIIYLLICSLGIFYGKFNYSMVVGDFANSAFPTITGSILTILLIYIISNFVADKISENNIFIKMGQNTFSIMANHLLIFFSINYVFYKLSLIPPSSLSNVFFTYKIEKFWIIYVLLGIFVPLFASLMVKKYKIIGFVKFKDSFLKTIKSTN